MQATEEAIVNSMIAARDMEGEGGRNAKALAHAELVKILGFTAEEADAIYKMTALASMEERVVIPPMQREMAIEMLEDPHEHRGSTGFNSGA